MSPPGSGPGPQEFILEISYDTSDRDADELVQSALFVTPSRGSSLHEKDGRTVVTAWFDGAEERDAARAAFHGLAVEIHAFDRDPVNWLERYQQSLRAIEIGRRFIVAPASPLIPEGTGRLSLVVPQEQAFGTGSHETTALCLELLEQTAVENRRGLDVGSGSGILALGMIRLGAAKAIAFDNDPDAYAALRENRLRNGVAEARMPVFIGSVEALRAGRFDVVTMNILPDVIVVLLPDVLPRLAPGARLIVSGVLVERRGDVVAAAGRHGLRVDGERVRGEWWAAALQRER